MTRDRDSLDDSIERAAEAVGSAWPLHSFVAANPLAGLEDRPFHRAVAEAERLFGGRGYPHPSVFRRAWERGEIDPDALRSELAAHGVDRQPETLLDEMAAAESPTDSDADSASETVDRILSKWLAAFLDEGKAVWSMPNREAGFYAAWRELAPHDDDVPGCDRPADLPETPAEALSAVLSDYPPERRESIFERHLAALPGWTGFVKRRADSESDPWQARYPITLTGYLAVRLTLADLLDAPIEPDERLTDGDRGDDAPLAEAWLTAWEESYREQLLDGIDRTVAGSTASEDDEARPAAQLVFCIDTRSEVVRRHVEDAGPYETHGYAGFFGIPMRYRGYESDVEIDACPPIVDPQHRVVDRPETDERDDAATYDLWTELTSAARKHLKALKTDVAAAFTFVEGAGSAYGAAMASRTLFPSVVRDAADAVDDRVPAVPEFCTPAIDREHGAHADGDLPSGMTLSEKVTYAETAFELMGWEEFARLVVFTGHASETTNNPFDSSLDCGACAGNPGGPSARVLAAICNDPDVRSRLRDDGFDIPSDTAFLAAEHNTTTDEIALFDGDVPESHRDDVERLRADLERARAGAAAERTESMRTGDRADGDRQDGERTDGVRETERRAADWAETRPEWGLAGNASFVVGPRDLTEDQNLEGRAFLHSYDWATDSDGEALEAILTGPLVVTQWINSQYYFASVDNAAYGSGSKVTQNPLGNVGVVQGNGGDLMTGLPLQSLSVTDDRLRHRPLRLTAVILAPTERVTDVLDRREEVARLFDNGWASLTVLDPTRDGEALRYQGGLEWQPNVRTPLADRADTPSSHRAAEPRTVRF